MKRLWGPLLAVIATLAAVLGGVGATSSPAHAATTKAPTTIHVSAVKIDNDFHYQVTVKVSSASGIPSGDVEWRHDGSMGSYTSAPYTAPLDATGTATFVFDAGFEAYFGWHADVNGEPNVDWWVPVSYPGDATHASSSTTYAYTYPRRPVVLTAAKVATTSGLVTTVQLSATLKYADGTPVVGRELSFWRGKAAPDGNTNRIVCRATTSSTGIARCTTSQAWQVYYSDGAWVTSPITPDDSSAQLAIPLR
ncbi:hypothetical protein [Nocardioides montaniterrae]